MRRNAILAWLSSACLCLIAVMAGVASPRVAAAPAPQAAAVRSARVQAASEPPLDYNWDVRPILSDNCFRCHGPDEKARQAGLRLDTPEGAYGPLRRPELHAIVPGKPDESQVIFRVAHGNPLMRMPPLAANKTISPAQVEILRKWIAQGAQYKPHWAFAQPQLVAAPAAPAGAAVRNDIDRYILAHLKREGLTLSAEADKETLINRVTLTLTGLPPTLVEVDAFVKDTSPTAYEKVVDRLLASPAYAEHMAEQWLDIARYADSDGFLDDLHDRLVWPYRDWVIGAFQKNMPFDQFATWQLAGDLMPSHTKEQLLATAFMRVGKRTTENGAIDEEYRVEYAIDRAMTIGTGFLSLTVGCARCHDHKYDPIPSKEFYGLTGFFNSIDEPGFYAPGRTGITPGPTLPWTDEATTKKIAQAEEAVRRAEAAYEKARQLAAREASAKADALSANAQDARQAIEQSLARGLVAYYPFDATAPITDQYLPTALPQARLTPPPLDTESLDERCTSNNGPLVSDEECRRRFKEQAEAAAKAGTQPRGLPGGFQRDDLMISPSAGGGAGPAVLMLVNLGEGVKGKAVYLTDSEQGVLGKGVGYFERTQPFSLDLWVRAAQAYEDSTILNHRETENAGNAGYQLQIVGGHLEWDMMHARAGNGISLRQREPLPLNQWLHLTLTYDGSSRAAGTHLYIDGTQLDAEVVRDSLTRTIIPNGNANQADHAVGLQLGKRLRSQLIKGGAIDELRVFKTALTPAEVRHLHGQTASAPSAAPTSKQDLLALLVDGDATVSEAFTALTAARNAENELVSVVPEVMIWQDMPKPRPTYALVRGNYDDHGDEVKPRGLAQVLPWSPAWPDNRLGLAKWLFDPKNPLTARVFVNRAWQLHFGRGIVETSEDFGSQGSLPTHPELLDYLAVSFRDSKWDIRKLHKLIVTSATYRQRSDATDQVVQKDPRNILLARYPRVRMPAELVRDNALAASGLLVKTIGGPSIYPYQPPNMWDGFNVYKYPTPDAVPADSLHRRTMYSFVKRNALHPAMATFDLPERGGTTARRRVSNSPLQALVLLDDPQYIEAYRALASHVIKAESANDAQVTLIFRLATRRRPTDGELAALRDYYTAQLAHFGRDRDAASKLLATGITAVDTTLDQVRLAALTNVTTVVMNTPDAYSLR